MVMSGGGFRFGMYLGMYQAACDAGQQPDVLLAGCGGAMAAALIHSMPAHVDRVAALASHEMYQFWTGIHATPQNNLSTALCGLVARASTSGRCPVIPDLFNDYLFKAPPLHLPVQTIKHSNLSGPDIAVIGCRLLFDAKEQAAISPPVRGDRKLFEETVFGSSRALQCLSGTTSGGWRAESAIAQHVAVDQNMPLDEAVKISVIDMFYFAPWQHRDDFYLGGVVDLFPLEMANRLAPRVIFERKSVAGHCFIQPAWRSVLGIDGRLRQQTVYRDTRVTTWIDTRNLSHALKLNGIGKKIDWRHQSIALDPPKTYDNYVRNIDAQVKYGYQQASLAFSQSKTM